MSFMKYLFCENDSSQLPSWNNIVKLKLANANALKLRLLVCFWSYLNIVVNLNWRRFNIRNLCQAKMEFHVLSTITLFIWCRFAHILDSFANLLQNYINTHIVNFHGLDPLIILLLSNKLSLHCIHSHWETWGKGSRLNEVGVNNQVIKLNMNTTCTFFEPIMQSISMIHTWAPCCYALLTTIN